MKEELTDFFKTNEKKSFSCVYKVYRKDKFDNMFVVYHMEGEPLSWKKVLFLVISAFIQKTHQ